MKEEFDSVPFTKEEEEEEEEDSRESKYTQCWQ
jgi:hypothetical protein